MWLLGTVIMEVGHGCKETVKCILVLDCPLTHHGPVMDVNNCFISQVPTLMKGCVVGQEFVEDAGLEGPSADTAAFKRWMRKKKEHALTGTNHGKKVSQVPKGCFH
jgi:hypothetical protein